MYLVCKISYTPPYTPKKSITLNVCTDNYKHNGIHSFSIPVYETLYSMYITNSGALINMYSDIIFVTIISSIVMLFKGTHTEDFVSKKSTQYGVLRQ